MSTEIVSTHSFFTLKCCTFLALLDVKQLKNPPHSNRVELSVVVHHSDLGAMLAVPLDLSCYYQKRMANLLHLHIAAQNNLSLPSIARFS